MNYKTLIVFLIMTTSAYGAEIKKNNLAPPLSIFTGLSSVRYYYPQIVNVFKKAYYYESRKNMTKFKTIVIPSFSPEYVIGVRQEGDKYIAFKLIARESIWLANQIAAKNKTSPNLAQIKKGVHEFKSEMSEKTYKVIEACWQKMLQNTKYPKELFSGLDGTRYHFTDSSILVGSAWSPDPESQTGYLVKLTELLGQLTESKEPKRIEIEIFNTGTKLLESLSS